MREFPTPERSQGRRLRRLGTTVALGAVLALLPSPPVRGQNSNGIAAVVNSKVITKSEVDQVIQAQEMLLRQQFPAGGRQYEDELATIQKQALQDLIDRELILDYFESKGGFIKKQYVDETLNQLIRERFDNDKQKFLDELKKMGMTIKKFRELREKMLIVQAVRGQQTNSVPPPTPAERDRYLEENKSKFREESRVKLRTITIPKFSIDPTITAESQRRLIQEIRQRIVKGGADFASEARTYSQDSVASDGGDRGWIGEDVLNRQLSEVAFSLDGGEFSEVIEDATNYYILWAEDKEVGKLKPREEIEDDLNKLVLQEKRMKAYDEWMSRLRDKATIKTFD